VYSFIFAYFLDGSFAYVCGLIGSCATVFDSIILPVMFYNVVHRYHHHNHYGTYWLHAAILLVAVTSAFTGIYSNISHVIMIIIIFNNYQINIVIHTSS